MKVRLEFITETAKARLYRESSGKEYWIPRSVCHSFLKFPAKDLNSGPIHEVDLEDWWWEKQFNDQDIPDDDLRDD